MASGVPDWVSAQLSAPVPAHDEKADAAVLYADSTLTVEKNGNMVRRDRRVLRILRPEGERYGLVQTFYTSLSRLRELRGWSIPANGKSYAVSEGDAIETGLPGVQNGVIASDLRVKVLRIPAATPGSTVAYEIERELWPYQIADNWIFQDAIPVREAHYTLSLPAGWSYSATWLNHPEIAPTAAGANQWQWVVQDVERFRVEPHMPPLQGLLSQLVVEPISPTEQSRRLDSWHDVGVWYGGLTQGRRDPAPPLIQMVADLTASKATTLDKMHALADFVQKDIRYVGIELGIGGYQPHPAVTVFNNGYGDCKDKVTLLSAMLRQIGIESYYVLVNTERGSITEQTPSNLNFNHAILAVRIPADLQDPTIQAQVPVAGLGNVLIFDPTDEYTPFGYIRGRLQGDYALVVAPDGGSLVALPQSPTELRGIRRTGKLTLDEQGTLRGDVHEVRLGDEASQQRFTLQSVASDTDRIKPVEALVADSFTTVTILKASVGNLHDDYRSLIWNYSLEAANYAKPAGNLLLLRPRVLGTDARDFLETKDTRTQAIEFNGPEQNTDDFEVTLPAGYQAEELPMPVDMDYGFASYHSHSELAGKVLRYSRRFELKDVSVPASKAEELRAFYRLISSDERKLIVLKKQSS